MKLKKSLIEQMYKDLRKEWKTEKKAMEEYIAKLEDMLKEQEKERDDIIKQAEEKMQELADQIPVTNDHIAGFHHAGVVEDEEYYEEDTDDKKLLPEEKQTQNGYQGIGYMMHSNKNKIY